MNIITTLVYWSLSYTKSCCLNKKELGISFCRHHYVTKTVSPKLYPRENLYFKITISITKCIVAIAIYYHSFFYLNSMWFTVFLVAPLLSVTKAFALVQDVTVQALVQTRAPAYAQQKKRTQRTTRKFLKV